MAKNIKKIAELLGAKVVGQVPETGGGAFGADLPPDLVAGHEQRLFVLLRIAQLRVGELAAAQLQRFTPVPRRAVANCRPLYSSSVLDNTRLMALDSAAVRVGLRSYGD
jgi:hypothetical protein